MSNQHQVSCEKKSAKKTFQMLTKAYGDETLSRAHVFEWYKRFSGGRVRVEDDEPPGGPTSAITDQNIAEIRVKSYLKGTHFTSVEEVQAKPPEGPSKYLVPELLPTMAAPNSEV
ncbi:hypothetical protein TNCV_1663891 [Trichonephila clavipes]|uniref:Mos1 transposase HTH domain-containing protein n=1 Tax=Trichonephila clavipes TaxID=2585209 RepID=A0A8X6VBS3_TRICX|nr:hypothetical protein TNCV_1663891 [Trichonephila clavipes]